MEHIWKELRHVKRHGEYDVLHCTLCGADARRRMDGEIIIKPRVGKPVRVLYGGTEFHGVLDGYEDLKVMHHGKPVMKIHDNPRIKLDDGRILYGYECWWMPTEECI